jgi:hypothetical protein
MNSDLTGVDQVGYTVTDLDRGIHFDTLFLGHEPFARKTWKVEYLSRIQRCRDLGPEAAFFRLLDGLTLELIQYRNPRRPWSI